MSTFVKLLPPVTTDRTAQSPYLHGEPTLEVGKAAPSTSFGALDSFADEQIRGLVRQLFAPGWPKPCRQVVFSPVDATAEVAAICNRVGEILAEEVSAAICVVDATRHPARGDARASQASACEKHFGALRDLSQQVSDNLWLMPNDVFFMGNESGPSAAWLRARLAELRLEFDFTVLHGPVAGAGNEAALLGATCDGVVLVLQANHTRRATAQRVKENLHSANVRLLGAVLSERTFPIPSAIYRWL